LAKEKLELEEKGKEVVKKKEEERSAVTNQYILKTFQHVLKDIPARPWKLLLQ